MDAKTQANTNVKDLVVFEGTRAKFQAFWSNFWANMTLRGLTNATNKEFDGVLPEIEMEEGQTAAQKKNMLKNVQVMSYLVIIIKCAALIVRLEKMKTKSWPGSKARRFPEDLLNKYRPKDFLVSAEQKKLVLIELKQGEDPENLGTRIAQLEIQYRNVLADSKKVAVFILAAGTQYASSINSKIRNIEKRGKEVTCNKLIEFIHNELGIGGGCKKPRLAIEEGETSLSNLGNVICNYCHEIGHLRQDCPDLVCKFPGCGKTGHHTEKCWRDLKNANMCPQWLKDKMATKKAAAETSGVEIVVPWITEDKELADWPDLPESTFL